jgi:hypothetical protein
VPPRVHDDHFKLYASVALSEFMAQNQSIKGKPLNPNKPCQEPGLLNTASIRETIVQRKK